MKNIICKLTLLTAFIGFSAFAQNSQTPINVTTTTPNSSLPQFTQWSNVSTGLNFTMQNFIGAMFCTDNACVNAVDSRWGTLKLLPNSPAPQIQFGGTTYTLLEFHFHTPSEHWVNNNVTDMEVHFVFFKNSDAPVFCNSNSLLVLGQRIVASGSDNSQWTKIFSSGVTLPINYAATPVSVTQFNIGGAIGVSPNSGSYRYSGGLTAPANLGCSATGNAGNQLATGVLPEVVSWVLLKQPLYLSAAQVAKFKTLFPGGNARDVQPVNSRTVYSTP